MDTEPEDGGPSAFEQRRLALKTFGIKHFLPLGLCLALIISLSFPQPGKEVRD